jgi:3-isopropylmalate dehydrogenase
MSAKTKTVITVLAGDGIGQEVMQASLPLLREVARRRGHRIRIWEELVGFAAYDVHGDVMPETTWQACRESNAILFGAVGRPDRDEELAPEMRPERRALLPLRQRFELGCNIRPIRVHAHLTELSPLKQKVIPQGVNLTFFRELIGGDYFGKRRADPGGEWAEDVCTYERCQIEAIARAAFQMARETGEKVTSIDKANVLQATGTYWRQVVQEVHDREFPSVKLQHVYVDAMNLYLLTRPGDFQIVLCSNAHGDILSDGAAGLAGSMGLLPSASLNLESGYAMYEPAGGSAPDIAGKDIANPIGMVLSIAMLFRYTLRDTEAAVAIELATAETLKRYRTRDIATGNEQRLVGTKRMVEAIMAGLPQL